MLVLTRNEGEGITFPDLELEVKILRISGNRIQVGVDASLKIRALRSELVSSDLSGKFIASSPISGSAIQAKSALEKTLLEKTSDAKVESYSNRNIQERINLLQQTLDIAQRQLDRDELNRAEWTLDQLQPGHRAISKVSEASSAFTLNRTLPEQLAC